MCVRERGCIDIYTIYVNVYVNDDVKSCVCGKKIKFGHVLMLISHDFKTEDP